MTIKVLVVDDEMLVRRGIVLETDWKALGCVVVAEAENGEEGLQAARKYQPDLIVTDIRMPKMDGIGMVRALREEGNQAKVIFLTAYSEFEYARSAIKLLVSDYLLKPFEDGELEEAVNRAVKEILKSNPEPERVRKEILPAVKAGDKSRYVIEAMDYIDRHFADSDLSVGTIADSLGLSEGYLSRLFRKETDCTVGAYITRRRISQAMKLLSDCRVKVYEAADQVGYKDITYFSSTFKKITGITPSEYQERCRQ